MHTRRSALRALAATGVASFIDPVVERLAAQQPCADPASTGTLVGTLPLSRPGAPSQPFGVKFGGSGLDARLITDLSLLQPDRLITPNALAYVRTEGPAAAAAHRAEWTIKTSGLIARPETFTADGLRSTARAMGARLFECAGNNNPANFGLMSVAEWDGVPLPELVARLQPATGAVGVLVSGVDHDGQRSLSSLPGAGWIFPLGSLSRLGAFLAFRMNGEPLPQDHGMPVRLCVPGWYACAWIKWVNEIRVVGSDERATTQMKEFAGRTHQTAAHDLARDYAPADIQAAATPVRVEKRRGPAGLTYRIVGIVWGGTKPITELEIRFGQRGSWIRFPVCPVPRSAATWALWEYTWKPANTGVYDISLRVADPTVPQRRLDTAYYTRQVNVVEL
jgi:DMSO/TMAO reductase YedYZ molybdopterin-dependent catalytic subunit